MQMRTQTRTVTVLLVIVYSLPSASADELGGRWALKSAVKQGKKVVGLGPLPVSWASIEGSVISFNEGFVTKPGYKYTLRPQATPKEIDWKISKPNGLLGAADVKSWYGIYEINQDILTICVSADPSDRPNKFDTTHPTSRAWRKFVFSRDEEAVDADWPNIVGKWELGKRVNGPQARWKFLTILPPKPFRNESKIRWTEDSAHNGPRGTIRIDSSKNPHRVWGTVESGKQSVKVTGFYKLKNDKLTIVLGNPKNPPKTWKIRASSPQTLLELTKQP